MSQPSTIAVELTSVRFEYPDSKRAALDDVSLSVAPGEIVTLVGANGAGKSTLVSLIAGLMSPACGSVRVLGEPPTRRSSPNVGLAAQDDAVYPTLSCRENLSYIGRLSGRDGPTVTSSIDALTTDLHLGEFIDRRASAISGGERRRLHTAMAMVCSPPVVLLDEPTAGSDIDTRESIIAAVRSLADAGTAVVFSTHELPEVSYLDSTIALLSSGRLAAVGSANELMSRYGTGGIELVFSRGDVDLGGLGFVVAESSSDATTGELHVLLNIEEPRGRIPEVIAQLGAASAHLIDVSCREPSLADVYSRLSNGHGSPSFDETST